MTPNGPNAPNTHDNARPTLAPGSRSAVVLAAITREVEAHRARIDAARDLGEVTVTVKLEAGSDRVRGVVYQEERVCRRT